MKIKTLQNGEITLSFTDLGKYMAKSWIFNVANMSYNAIRENKILTKIFWIYSSFDVDWNIHLSVWNHISIPIDQVLIHSWYKLFNLVP